MDLGYFVQSGSRVARLADDKKVVLVCEQAGEPLAKKRMIVNQ
jgi:hypothetical protein